MYVHEVSKDNFILVRADWPTSKATELIMALEKSDNLDLTHVIIHRIDPEYFYLYTTAEVLDLLSRVSREISVHEALDLHEWAAIETFNAYVRVKETPERFVVLDDDSQVIGFIDKSARIRETRDHQIGYQEMEFFTTDRIDVSPSSVLRSLEADFPDEVKLNQTASLIVHLTAEAKLDKGLPIHLPIGTEIEVFIQPMRGFVLEGDEEKTLIISDTKETLPLRFKLKATELGQGKVRIIAIHQGQTLGALTIVSKIIPSDQPVTSQRSSHKQLIDHIHSQQPDLALYIFEQANNGKTSFKIRLTAADPKLNLNLSPFGPIKLQMNPLDYFNNFFAEIENLPIETPNQRVKAQKRLEAKGSELSEALIPSNMQDLLWQLRDRIQTIQIQSEEPWIPWELCRLIGKENGKIVEGPFLCERFAVTRWIPGISRKLDLNMQNIAIVAPDAPDLPYAKDERDYILSLANGGRKVNCIPANYLDVRKSLSSGEYDCWHFTGHGYFREPNPNLSAILLENQDKFIPEDLNGVVKNLGLKQPLVFLNACQIGRNAMSLTDIGGWAVKFLKANAAAFIGSFWSIRDDSAFTFAKSLYNNLMAGRPIGHAVKEARNMIKHSGDPTWLAYTVFADSLASLQ